MSDSRWEELRQTIKDLHESNNDNPDVEQILRFLLNLMDVKERS